MKRPLLLLVLIISLLSLMSCGYGTICDCHFAGSNRDTTYGIGRNVALSDLNARCKSIQKNIPGYDTCIGRELKD